MSRIGRKPVTVPAGADVSISGRQLKVKGPKGELGFDLPSGVNVDKDDRQLTFARTGEDRATRAMHGTVRALVANMIVGVTEGYERRLHIHGTGYGCNLAGRTLQLNCGFMGRGGKNKFQFDIPVPQGLDIEVEVAASRGDNDPAKMIIRGCDKQLVGQFAAEIRRLRPPEPYKGKGIRYSDEVVRRKAGKAVAGS